MSKAIIDRLNQLPPYADKFGNVTDTPPVVEKKVEEVPQEDINKETEVPQEDINKKVEVPEEEVKVEVKQEVKPEVTEEEALANSKNPERTKEYIEKLKKQNEELRKKPDILTSLAPKVEAPQWPQPVTTNIAPQEFPGLTKEEINKTFKGLVDENGYVGEVSFRYNDFNGRYYLNEELDQSRQVTQQTNKRLDDFERNETMREVHAQFPKLDPTNADESVPEEKRFDNKLWEYVRKNMVSEWVNEAATGKVVNPNDKVAQTERMKRITQKGMDFLNAGVLNNEGEVDISQLNMKKADKVKVQEADNAKRNINAVGPSQTTQRNVYGTQEERTKVLRSGKRGSIGAVLQQMGQ